MMLLARGDRMSSSKFLEISSIIMNNGKCGKPIMRIIIIGNLVLRCS
jgi:hypothetical protein